MHPHRKHHRSRRQFSRPVDLLAGFELLEARQMLAFDVTQSAAFELADINKDGDVNASDIDFLTSKLREGDHLPVFDLNRDGVLDDADRRYWIDVLKRTYAGDSNLDGQFDTGDLVAVFQAALYESASPGQATWETGDWNGDGSFDSSDLVSSFQAGAFEQGSRPLSEPSVEILANDAYSSIVQLLGNTDPYAMIRVNGDAAFANAADDGSFQVDAALASDSTELNLEVGDINGNQIELTIVIGTIHPSSETVVEHPRWGKFITTGLLFPELPSSLATAFTPRGVTRLSLADDALTKQELTPASRNAGPAEDAVAVFEDSSQANDELQDAQAILEFGRAPGQSSGVVVHGALTPSPTELVPVEDDGSFLTATETDISAGEAVVARAVIGDGPFGSAGSASGDFDFFAVRDLQEGQTITIDINTPPDSAFDSFIYLWNSDGGTVAANDDANYSSDSCLSLQVPDAGDYYISVGGFGSFAPADPYDSSSGFRAGSEGEYEIIISVEVNQDIDNYGFELQAGDILGAAAYSGARHITLSNASGDVLIGSGQDFTFTHPDSSPLPGGGNAALSWVVDQSGTYILSVDGGVGEYLLETAVFRPALASGERSSGQVLFLDFDGATLDASSLFGLGNANAELSPLSAFLPGWGLTEADESAVIDAIVANVRENFADVAQRGANGDRIGDGVDGHFQIEIATSRDSRDALGFRLDPFGSENVSRVVIGGSISELGIQTIGIAEAIDVGNFDTTDTAVVLLDLLSAPSTSSDSLNQYELAPAASTIELIGVGVGNIVTHEAGHIFAGWHTDQFNDVAVIMDQGGNMDNTVGVGPDRTFGTDDDIDVDFGFDSFVPNEGFTGTANTINAIAFGLSSGTVDPGMIVVGSTPSENQQLTQPPIEFRLRLIDPFDTSALPNPEDLTVNGISASEVTTSGSQELIFRFQESPVTRPGLQTLELAEGAVLRDSDRIPSAAFQSTFGYVVQPLVTTGIRPSLPAVELPLDQITVRVNQPYDPASVGNDDLVLSQGRVTGFELIDDVTIRYFLDGIVNEGEFYVTMPDGALTDTFGNRGDGFLSSHVLDIGLIPFAAAKVAKLPLGSAGYESTMYGVISPGDSDEFRFSVDPSQTLSLALRTDPSLRGSVRLLSGDSADHAGQTVVLQTEQVSGQLVGRRENLNEFVVGVSGLGDTYGEYSIQVLLNAMWEKEGLGGPVNDGARTAESIEAAFLKVDPQAASRAAVLGDLIGSEVVAEDFESGMLDSNWTVSSNTYFGRVRLTDEFGAADGSVAMIMDASLTVAPNLNEAVWQVNLAGSTQPILRFSHVNFDDERNPFVGAFQGRFFADGIAVSDDGELWHPVFDAPDTPFGQWQQRFVDLESAVAGTEVSLDGPLWIKFQQYDRSSIPTDGRGWDDIAIKLRDDSDWYRFDAFQEDSVTVAASAYTEGAVNLDLFGPDGALVAEGLNIHRPLANGSFEQGDFSHWTIETTGDTSRPWQVTGPNEGGGLFIDFTSPQDGQFAAWNGFEGDGPMQYRIYQDITIPAGVEKAELSWQFRAQWSFYQRGAQARTLTAEVVDPNDEAILETLYVFTTGPETENPGGDTGWQQLTHDLRSYAGSTVRIRFVEDIPESYTGPAQIEFDSIQLDLGETVPTNADDLISNYLVAQTGTHYVRVSGDPLTSYGLVTMRNADFGSEANNSIAAAQPLVSSPIQGYRWLLGFLDVSANDRDFYEVSLSSGQPFVAETQTPADGVGGFAIELDPILRLYDAVGNLVAEDDNSGSDGRNSSLAYEVPSDATGTYYLEVTSSDGTGGEYMLSVQGTEIPARLRQQIAAALVGVEQGAPDHGPLEALPAPADHGHQVASQPLALEPDVVDSIIARFGDRGWNDLESASSQESELVLDLPTGAMIPTPTSKTAPKAQQFD